MTCFRNIGWLTSTYAEDSGPFICWDCDERQAGFSHGEHHLAMHSLVPCMGTREEEAIGREEDNAEKRLGALELQMMGLRDQMEKIEALLHALANARR